ncbi:MAG: DUF2815 family protein [bacterium]|nr:DUF2815 family protein [bacterium]
MQVKIEDTFEHPVRLAFVQNLFKAGTVNGEGEPAYSVTAIIPRDHPAIAELEAAEDEVAKAKWGTKAAATVKTLRAAGKTTVKDGDTKTNYDGFEGNAFVSMRAKQNQKPNVYTSRGEAIGDDGTVYSGCYAHVICSVWAQENGYGKRLNAQVTGVKFTRDGDSFGGGASPATADDFADLSAADEGSDASLLS